MILTTDDELAELCRRVQAAMPRLKEGKLTGYEAEFAGRVEDVLKEGPQVEAN